jgi:hypothetical protein
MIWNFRKLQLVHFHRVAGVLNPRLRCAVCHNPRISSLIVVGCQRLSETTVRFRDDCEAAIIILDCFAGRSARSALGQTSTVLANTAYNHLLHLLAVLSMTRSQVTAVWQYTREGGASAHGRFQTVRMGKSGWFTSALRGDSPSGAADAKSLRAMQCVPLHGVAMRRMTYAGADRHHAERWDARQLLPYPSPNAGPTLVRHGQSHASGRWRRRKASARSTPHRRQRHRCSVRSMRRFS